MDFCRFWHRLAWKSALYSGNFHADHGISAAKATRHVAAVLSLEISVVPTMANHGNPRKLPKQFPRSSVAVSTATRQSPQKSADVRGNYHGSFRGRSIEAVSTAIRGHPRILQGDPPIRGNFHGSTWESETIVTAHAPVLSAANSVVPIMPTAVRARGRESCRGSYRGCLRGPIHGCPRTFPQTSTWVFP